LKEKEKELKCLRKEKSLSREPAAEE